MNQQVSSIYYFCYFWFVSFIVSLSKLFLLFLYYLLDSFHEIVELLIVIYHNRNILFKYQITIYISVQKIRTYWNWSIVLNFVLWNGLFLISNYNDRSFPKCKKLPRKIDHCSSRNHQSINISKGNNKIFFEMFSTYFFLLNILLIPVV